MRFAEPYTGVDIERIEYDRIAAPCGRNLLRRRMGKRIRTTDHEGLEGQPRVERRPSQSVVHIDLARVDRAIGRAVVHARTLAVAKIGLRVAFGLDHA